MFEPRLIIFLAEHRITIGVDVGLGIRGRHPDAIIGVLWVKASFLEAIRDLLGCGKGGTQQGDSESFHLFPESRFFVRFCPSHISSTYLI